MTMVTHATMNSICAMFELREQPFYRLLTFSESLRGIFTTEKISRDPVGAGDGQEPDQAHHSEYR